jgi:hypothetical protein
MENLEIIILSSIIFTLFAVFIIGPMLYAHKIEKNRLILDHNLNRSNGRISRFKKDNYEIIFGKFMKLVFKNKSITPKNKKHLAKVVSRTISDMESDGIYFPHEIKKELIKRRNEICEYSGLPSIKSYDIIKNK